MRVYKSTSSEIFNNYAARMIKRAGAWSYLDEVLEGVYETAAAALRSGKPEAEILADTEKALAAAGHDPSTARKVFEEVSAGAPKATEEAAEIAGKGVGQAEQAVSKGVSKEEGELLRWSFAESSDEKIGILQDALDEAIRVGHVEVEGKVYNAIELAKELEVRSQKISQSEEIIKKLESQVVAGSAEAKKVAGYKAKLVEREAILNTLKSTTEVKIKELEKQVATEVAKKVEAETMIKRLTAQGKMTPAEGTAALAEVESAAQKTTAKKVQALGEKGKKITEETTSQTVQKTEQEIAAAEGMFGKYDAKVRPAIGRLMNKIESGNITTKEEAVRFLTLENRVDEKIANQVVNDVWNTSRSVRNKEIFLDFGRDVLTSKGFWTTTGGALLGAGGTILGGAAKLLGLGALGVGGYLLYQHWFGADPDGVEKVRSTLKTSITNSITRLRPLQFKVGTQGETLNHDVLAELQDNLKSIDYLNPENESQFNYAHSNLAELQKLVNNYLTSKDILTGDLISQNGYPEAISSLQDLQSILTAYQNGLEKYQQGTAGGAAATEMAGGGPGPESPASAIPKSTLKPQLIPIYGEMIDVSKEGPQHRSLASTLSKGLLSTPLGMAFVDPDNVWGGYFPKTGDQNIDIHQSLNFLINQKIYDKADLRRFMRHSMPKEGRKRNSGWQEAVRYYEQHAPQILSRSAQAERELRQTERKEERQPAAIPIENIEQSTMQVPVQPSAQEASPPSSSPRQQRREERQQRRQDRRERRQEKRSNFSQNNNDFDYFQKYSINKNKRLVNKVANMTDQYSNKYYQDAVKGLEEQYSQSYYTGLKGMYGQQGESPADVGSLYSTQKETGADLIGQAHPKSIVVSDAMGRGGLVENGLEQQMHTQGVALSTPSGNYRSKHAWLLNSLVKLANQADRDGNTEASDLVDSTFHQILELMKLDDIG